MRNLELKNPHMTGGDVGAWQRFLASKGYAPGRVDNDFGQHTHNATIVFQRNHHLYQDGVVGQRTRETAQRYGFMAAPSPPNVPSHSNAPNPPRPHPPVPPPSSGGSGNVPQNSTTYPPRPNNPPQPTLARTQSLFGRFSYAIDPQPGDACHIRITDGWENNNIVRISVPQLNGVQADGGRSRGTMWVHRLISNQVRGLFSAWEAAGLTHLILFYGGAFNPRFMKRRGGGCRRSLSNHAFGSAFDINVAWNHQGNVPAATGTRGSVRELVPIANSFGFFWGGHFSGGSIDGMHFEASIIR